jgi:hypothetical protein
MYPEIFQLWAEAGITWPSTTPLTIHPNLVFDAMVSISSPTLDSWTASRWAWSNATKTSTFPPVSPSGRFSRCGQWDFSLLQSVTGVGLAAVFKFDPSRWKTHSQSRFETGLLLMNGAWSLPWLHRQQESGVDHEASRRWRTHHVLESLPSSTKIFAKTQLPSSAISGRRSMPMVTFWGAPVLAVVGRTFCSPSDDAFSWSPSCSSGWWKYLHPDCLDCLSLSHSRTECLVEKQLKHNWRRIQKVRRSPTASNIKSSQSGNLCSFSHLKQNGFPEDRKETCFCSSVVLVELWCVRAGRQW